MELGAVQMYSPSRQLCLNQSIIAGRSSSSHLLRCREHHPAPKSFGSRPIVTIASPGCRRSRAKGKAADFDRRRR